MQWFYDLKIATKLIVSFGAVLLLTLLMGMGGVIAMGRVNQASTDLAGNWMPSVRAVMELRIDVGELLHVEVFQINPSSARAKSTIYLEDAAGKRSVTAEDELPPLGTRT